MPIAVIKTGGKQYKVKAGDILKVENISSKDNVESVEFVDILAGKKVKANIIFSGKDKKIRVFKFKPKKRYKRTYGHRQPYTKIEIKEIK